MIGAALDAVYAHARRGDRRRARLITLRDALLRAAQRASLLNLPGSRRLACAPRAHGSIRRPWLTADRTGPNRLAQETSPYLLQHAHNPVDWYPWGDEALERAQREDKPIFLSIGYSACHWCHVMERECFENQAIAALMNELFVNIKVDREERPDLDEIYMKAVTAMTGSGGWPMSVFLTPELQAVLRRDVPAAERALRPAELSRRAGRASPRRGASEREAVVDAGRAS